MIDTETIKNRARRRRATLERARRDSRYRRVLGRLIAAGVLSTTEDIEPHRSPIAIDDALWAGRVEPRILELLPALIIKRPSIFDTVERLPEDLRATVAAVKKNRQPDNFRGIPGADLLRWLPLIGRKNRLPSQLRSYRMQTQDLAILERLSEALGLSHAAVLRRSLRELAARVLKGTG
jgi:hypothetical protein